MPTCIVCDQGMGNDDHECDECGEPGHESCLAAGCPSCRDIEERAEQRKQRAAKLSPKTTENPFSDKPPKVVPPPPKQVPVAARKPIPEPTQPKVATKPRKKEPEPVPGGEVAYEKGSFPVMIGVGCPPGGVLFKFRAIYKQDPDGFRGYGDTETEALANLESYAFGSKKGD